MFLQGHLVLPCVGIPARFALYLNTQIGYRQSATPLIKDADEKKIHVKEREILHKKNVFREKIRLAPRTSPHNESRESSKRDKQISTMRQEQHSVRCVLAR